VPLTCIATYTARVLTERIGLASLEVITNARSLPQRHIEVWMTGDAFAHVGLQSPTSNE
jgi:hypothetical protein